MNLKDFIEVAAIILEFSGVGVIVLGALFSGVYAVRNLIIKNTKLYTDFRQQFSRAILLGLEFLVAADIIRTVAVEPTFISVGVLGIIVLIRTFLSFTLELEISGYWPWQKHSESSY